MVSGLGIIAVQSLAALKCHWPVLTLGGVDPVK